MVSEYDQNLSKSARKQLLTLALRNACRQLNLGNQVLDLSKLESGKMSLRANQKDFIPHLKGVVHSYESLAPQKKTDLSVECLEGPLMLYFDRDRMEQILYNLVSLLARKTPLSSEQIIERLLPV